MHLSTLQINIMSRYEFSEYLIDPNKFRFQKVVRIIAFVQMFIGKCKLRCNAKLHKLNSSPEIESSNNIKITDNEFQEALNYFFQKATNEVKQFNSSEKYERLSSEKMAFCTTTEEYCHVNKSMSPQQ